MGSAFPLGADIPALPSPMPLLFPGLEFPPRSSHVRAVIGPAVVDQVCFLGLQPRLSDPLKHSRTLSNAVDDRRAAFPVSAAVVQRKTALALPPQYRRVGFRSPAVKPECAPVRSERARCWLLTFPALQKAVAQDLDAAIEDCDFLSVHLHLTEDTKHIIDRPRIALLKATSYVINVARGGLIDEDALYDALRDNKIAGAGLDAFAKEPPEFDLPVYKLPNVIVQPHTVAGTDGTMRKRADFAVENLRKYAEGKEIEGRIFKRL